jgi:hypothetical protein
LQKWISALGAISFILSSLPFLLPKTEYQKAEKKEKIEKIKKKKWKKICALSRSGKRKRPCLPKR